MATLQGIKPSPSGMYWCNVQLSNGKLKLALAKQVDAVIGIFQLKTCSSGVKNEPGWHPIPDKNGWFEKEVLLEEINEFFNYNL